MQSSGIPRSRKQSGGVEISREGCTPIRFFQGRHSRSTRTAALGNSVLMSPSSGLKLRSAGPICLWTREYHDKLANIWLQTRAINQPVFPGCKRYEDKPLMHSEPVRVSCTDFVQIHVRRGVRKLDTQAFSLFRHGNVIAGYFMMLYRLPVTIHPHSPLH